MILYPEETSWNTLRFDKRNYTIQKAKEQQKEIIKKIPEQYVFIDDRCFKNAGRIKEVILSPQCKIIGKQASVNPTQKCVSFHHNYLALQFWQSKICTDVFFQQFRIIHRLFGKIKCLQIIDKLQ